MFRIALVLFAAQAGYQAYTASLPLALARAGTSDPLIGLIVGIAALVQVPSAIVVGGLVDRFGGIRLLAAGMAAYVAGSAVLLVPGVDPAGSLAPFAIARILQGIGIGACLPSALSLVPRAVDLGRRSVALAVVQSANNLATIVVPPLSLAALDAGGAAAVATLAIVIILGGCVLLASVPGRLRPVAARPAGAPQRLRLVLRRAWISPLAVITLYLVHWGVIVAYLPQRVEEGGVNVALFFVADGAAVLVSRPPTGWLTDRIRPHRLVGAGLTCTTLCLLLLLQVPSPGQLLVSGLLAGAGGGLVMTPLLVELARRSDDADRGSAFALFSAATALGMGIGSMALAPLVGSVGFDGGVLMALAAVAAALVLAVADRGAAVAPLRVPAAGETALEVALEAAAEP